MNNTQIKKAMRIKKPKRMAKINQKQHLTYWIKCMSFEVDSQISSTCFELADWPLSRVVLKNNADYPWLILIPRVENITEIDQLPQQARYLLMDEISQLSTIVRSYFKPDKVNIGSLGNIVAQLHVHVIGRFIDDALWPFAVWQKTHHTNPYREEKLSILISDLQNELKPFIKNRMLA